MRRLAWLALCVFVSQPACSALVFPCTDASQCIRDGHGGAACVSAPGATSRYCAFADGQCASGLRFDPTAGEGLSAQCVAASGVDGGPGPDMPQFNDDIGSGNDASPPDDLAMPSGMLTFTAVTSPANGNLWSVCGYDDNHVWTGGPDGIWFTANGGMTWTKQVLPGDAGDFSAMFCPPGAPHAAWAANHETQIFYTANDGAAWTLQTVPQAASGPLYGLWGDGPRNVFAVGEAGLVLHTADGKGWAIQNVPGDNLGYLNAAWGATGTDVWATGGSGVVGVRSPIVHTVNGGVAWMPGSLPSDFSMYAIGGTAANDVYAVGEQQVIYHSTGGGFTQARQPTGNTNDGFTGVWSGSGGLLVIGTGGLAVVTVDGGKTWIGQATGTGADLSAVWGATPDRAWVVGQGGTVLHVTR